MRQSFCLIQVFTFQNSAYRAHFAGDHHNKMLRPWPLRSAMHHLNTFDGGVSRLHGFKSQRGAGLSVSVCHDRIQSRCSGT